MEPLSNRDYGGESRSLLVSADNCDGSEQRGNSNPVHSVQHRWFHPAVARINERPALFFQCRKWTSAPHMIVQFMQTCLSYTILTLSHLRRGQGGRRASTTKRGKSLVACNSALLTVPLGKVCGMTLLYLVHSTGRRMLF